ncbi:MAG: pilin [Minisyncoccia bacterium]
MNKKYFKRIILILSLLYFVSIPALVLASMGYPCSNPCPPGYYQFETGIPFLFSQCQCVSHQNYLSFINNFIKTKLFPLAGFIGFLVIIYAGFEYALSGGDQNKQKDAQNKIQNVLIGIALLFLMWVILYIINPDILRTKNLTLPNIDISPDVLNGNNPKPNNIVDSLPGFTKICNSSQSPIPYSKTEAPNPETGCFYIKEDLLNALKDLYKTTGNTWVLTEACQALTSNPNNPCWTILNHKDPSHCHELGTCVDIALNDTPNNDTIQKYIEFLNNSGFDVYNEYDKTCNPNSTGGHFHCALHKFHQCTPSKCWHCSKSK